MGRYERGVNVSVLACVTKKRKLLEAVVGRCTAQASFWNVRPNPEIRTAAVRKADRKKESGQRGRVGRGVCTACLASHCGCVRQCGIGCRSAAAVCGC